MTYTSTQSLVITIIVLLILAGISISMLSGDNGILKQTENARIKTQLAGIQEQANLIYMDLNSKNILEVNKNKVTLKNVMDIMLSDNEYSNEIYSKVGAGADVTLSFKDSDGNIVPSEKIKVKNSETKTYTIEIKVDNTTSATAYYAKVLNKYYPITMENNKIVINDREEKISDNYIITSSSNKQNVVEPKINGSTLTLIGKSEGTAKISIAVNGIEKTILDLSTLPTITASEIASMTPGSTELKNIMGKFITNYNPTRTTISDGEEITTYGNNVIGQLETDALVNNNEKWRLFYVGKLTDDDSEDRIWITTADYISWAPTTGMTIPSVSNKYKWKLGEVYKEYINGSEDIGISTTVGNNIERRDKINVMLRNLNKNYFDFLKSQTTTISKNNNIKGVAYILDTDIWNEKFLDNETNQFGEFAIGGPSLELLFKAYNKKVGLPKTEESTIKYAFTVGSLALNSGIADTVDYTINTNGYRFNIDGQLSTTNSWKNDMSYVFSYSDIPEFTNYTQLCKSYWIASPNASGASNSFYIGTEQGGSRGSLNYTGMSGNNSCGFRPLVYLKSGVTLKEVEGGFELVN